MLAKIYNNQIVYPMYGNFVEICGRLLFNPTEQTYIDLGFEELPTLEEREGFHTEYSLATRTVQKTIEDEFEGEKVIEVEEQYIVANYVENPPEEEEEIDEEAIAKQREDAFKREFFETSLGWVRKKAKMKDGTVDNFLTDDLPLLAIGLQNGLTPKVIVYSTPNFYNEIDILSLQSYVNVTLQFIAECLQEKQNEFKEI